ncbi:MAG: hypothetical protein RBU37_28420, partial [Myxococcota bacterium]|nr:hypothetical protein [Myxococcota bacterium]
MAYQRLLFLGLVLAAVGCAEEDEIVCTLSNGMCTEGCVGWLAMRLDPVRGCGVFEDISCSLQGSGQLCSAQLSCATRTSDGVEFFLGCSG